MGSDEFLKLATSRKSTHRFLSDPVPDEAIEKMIEAARWAQSGANAQPWEFIVVKDKETKAKIVDIYRLYTEAAWDIEKTRLKELRHTAFADGAPTSPQGFQDAPVFIVVCGDPRPVQASILITHFIHMEGGPMAHFMKSMANATQMLHLAAAALGLGSQWLSINRISEPHLKTLLDVPDELTIPTIVPVGYPVPGQPRRGASRRELAEITHFEKYDRSKYRSGDDIYRFLLALRKRTTPV